MRLIAAVCLTLSLAWLWDRLLRLLKFEQKIRIGIGVPIGEEAIKYFMAVAFHFHPLIIYSLFGFGEGCLETFLLKKPSALKLIIAGGLIHFCFGVFFLFPIPPIFSLSFGITAHLLWNNLLIKD